MFEFEPRDVLIECKMCGTQNAFSHYTPENAVFCKDCREELIHAGLDDSHNEFICEDCGFTMLLLKETPYKPGEEKCRCGSENVLKMDTSTLVDEAREFQEYGDDKDLDDEEAEDDEDEDSKWLRSHLDEIDEDDRFDRDSDDR